MQGYVEGRPYYRACAWEKAGGDPLVYEYFTTKREAISCLKKFKKTYEGYVNELDCYARLFDENGDSVDDFDV
jgi:hypothetical protein